MKGFPKGMKFKYPWRPYQGEILKDLESHLSDNKLHVVAAPGSGKTVLGLEVLRQLDKPTLVLAPSVAIKDQWVDRLVELFLGDPDERPSWISKDIKNPGFFTVSTYQGLHVAYKQKNVEEKNEDADEEEDEGSRKKKKSSKKVKKVDVIKELKKTGIQTIVVDEAHHLRTAWWRSLSAVIENLDNPTTLALTATPPYDVDPAEWKRYSDLCGAIDAEINVPELVKAKNLCPHQDYVHFCTPNEEEMQIIRDFEKNVDKFLADLIDTPEFTHLIMNHHWIKHPNDHVEDILDNPALYSSMLIYMKYAKVEIPKQAIELVAGENNSVSNIPVINNYWMGVLLSGIFGDPDGQGKLPPEVEALRKQLHQIGAIEKRHVSLNLNDKVAKLLATSLSKMDSIEEIVKAEHKAMKDKLRMVVLTDYIRKNMLPASPEDMEPPNKIGVVPIFETIRRMKVKGLKLGVLTGGLIYVPAGTEKLVKEAMKSLDLDEGLVKFKDLKFTRDFIEVDFQSRADARKVAIITEVFINGGIHVLVGTKSLLGEGWDAPVVNSLVLATFVGSFMFSNQMRGRAIRTVRGDPGKNANIWHLVCIMPDNETPGDDYAIMERRFKAFVGISQDSDLIQNGIQRLALPTPPFSKNKLEEINQKTMKAAMDRKGMIRRWNTSLEKGGSAHKLVEKVIVKENYALKRLVIPRGFKKAGFDDIATVLLKVLCGTDTIKSKFYDLRVEVEKEAGEYNAYLKGGTRKEQSLFLSSLEEIIDPPENQKYLIAGLKRNKIDMDRLYAIPKILCRKKGWAQYYSDKWAQHVSKNELIYTRTKEGRLILLKARNKSTYERDRNRAERLSRWE
ncbi:MAG: DEAD/DEAH box helicase family protein [Promethearchaeota archaeon]